MNSIIRYCQLWKPLLEASDGRIAEYSGGVIVASTSQAWTSCSMILLTRASVLKAGLQSVGCDRRRWRRRSSCSISFIHSSLTWCWTMKSISSCVPERSCCALSTASRWR
jgi:hypothetical protein